MSIPSNDVDSEKTNRPRLKTIPAVLGILGMVLWLGCWEITARIGIGNRAFLPPPSTVALAAFELIISGELLRHITASVWRAVLGFLIGSTAGAVVGVATARFPIFRFMTDPILQMFRAIPSIAFVSLAIFWFGIGETSKIFLISWGVFFPVWINTFLGVRDFSPIMQRAAATLGARGLRFMWSVVLPGALPMIIAGLRIGLAVALVLLVAAELAGAVSGVGYFIQLSAQVFRVDQMFVGLLTLGVLGFCADFIFVRTILFLFPWYGAENRAAEWG